MQIKKIPFLFFMALFSGAVNAQMVLEYNIVTANTGIALPLNGNVNVQVDWGDGSASESFVTAGDKPHTYATTGTKTVTITGTVTQFGSLTNTLGSARLTKILSWDGVGLKSLSYACSNSLITQVPASLPTTVIDLSYMFFNAYVFNQPIGSWNTGLIKNMQGMFGCNQTYTSLFNQPIGSWNTSAVTNMSFMFFLAGSFNQPIGNWNTAAVTDMNSMFETTGAFNQPIDNWNTAAVKDMSFMFYGAYAFNQPIGSWNTAAVTKMSYMFGYARLFNQPIGNWNTAAVTKMSYMFGYARLFNQPIGNWNTAAVTNMSYMFDNNLAFNQPIGSWNTSAVTDMSLMFHSAQVFNQPIGNWNTAQVKYMHGMFANSPVFNQPVNAWNTSKVTDMSSMFASAPAFNQPLGNWNITAVTDMTNMFFNAGLCTYNYDATLNGWSSQIVKSGVNFNGGSSRYSAPNTYARATLISKGWVIIDGGLGVTGDAKCANASYYNIIRGNIYTDANADCINQVSETPISSVIVKAMPGAYYGYTDINGNYAVRVDTGTVSYTITQQFNGVNTLLLLNQCAPSHIVSLKGASKDTASFDFADEVKSCRLPTVDIQHTQLIRCRRSNAYIQYCNVGNAAIDNASIKVEYPVYLIPISSVPMWTSKTGSVLIYDVGTMPENFCGQITIVDSVDCSSQPILGLTQCIKATITPRSTCTSPSTLWDLSSTEVTGACENNQAAFVLTNTGDGNMADSLAYRIYVNDTLIYNGKYKLLSGSTLKVKYPAQAQTVRLEADQHPNHPGNSHPKAIVESCGVSSTGFVPKGLVTTTPLDDLDEESDIVCYPIRSSFDPNDKQASPTGTGLTHQVAPGTELEYTIRFQNTGTAMANTVKIIDILDIDLDAASLIQGVSSHPYTLHVEGKGQAVLIFTFDNINLPDSTTDRLGSNGLVSFKITIPSDAALGTVINNKAYIYFDYNDAIITNNTMHTVGITTVQNLTKGDAVEVVNPLTTGVLYSQNTNAVKMYPNPSDGMVTLEMAESGNNMELRITSVVGVLQKTIKLTNAAKQQVNLEGMHQGMYLYEVWKDGERSSVGTMQIW